MMNRPEGMNWFDSMSYLAVCGLHRYFFSEGEVIALFLLFLFSFL